jgi:agmatine deiminase
LIVFIALPAIKFIAIIYFMNRRKLVNTALLLSTSLPFNSVTAATSATTPSWRMPDEAERHTCTWMAFGANKGTWGAKLLPEVQHNLALIANTIAKYEPVNMLVNSRDLALAQSLMGKNVILHVCPLDDLWMRDTGPVFVSKSGKKAGIQFNFNGWGEKQAFKQDALVASFVAKQAKVELLRTKLVLEGGCIEVDGHGTAIMTESCILNDNRNPSVSKAAVELELKRLLGLQKIIWLPGIKGKDITDGHTDFYARFASPGVVIAGFDPDTKSYDHAVTVKHLSMLKTATDAQGRKLEVITLEAPSSVRKTFENKEFAAGYIGFYVCNGAVIAQEFGDAAADAAVKASLQRAFPNRTIEMLNVDGIAAGGGSIHCTTQQEIAI